MARYSSRFRIWFLLVNSPCGCGCSREKAWQMMRLLVVIVSDLERKKQQFSHSETQKADIYLPWIQHSPARLESCAELIVTVIAPIFLSTYRKNEQQRVIPCLWLTPCCSYFPISKIYFFDGPIWYLSAITVQVNITPKLCNKKYVLIN